MSRPEVWYFVHFISKLLSVIAVVHHQADVLHLETEGAGDLVHQGEGDTHHSAPYKCQISITTPLQYYIRMLNLNILTQGNRELFVL